MTSTALVVLMTALAADQGRPAEPALPGQPAVSPTPADPAQLGITCALRIVHASPDVDAGILGPRPRSFEGAVVTDDAMVRDSVSPCAGTTTRRAARPGTQKR